MNKYSILLAFLAVKLVAAGETPRLRGLADDAEKGEKCGQIWGDPHVRTFDKYRYDCQGQGEFVIAQSKCSGDPLRIHGRFVAGKNGKATVTRSVAIKVQEDVPVVYISVPYELDAKTCPFLFSFGRESNTVNKEEILGQFNSSNTGTAKLAYFEKSKKRKNLMVRLTYEEGTNIEIISRPTRINGCVLTINVCITPENHGCAECIVGLIGTPNGNKQDDWTTLEGDILQLPPRGKTKEEKEEKRKKSLEYCKANWCVSEYANSLYDLESFNEHPKCSTSVDMSTVEESIEALPADQQRRCEETTEVDECLLDAAMDIDEAEAGAEGAALEAVDGVLQDISDGEAIHGIPEAEADQIAYAETELASTGNFVEKSIPANTESMFAVCEIPTPCPTLVPTPDPTPGPTLAPITIIDNNITNGTTHGDPHFKTWHNERFEYHGQCDLMLLKDETFANGIGLEVQIRTKLVRFWSYIRSVSIRIGDDILEVEGSADAYPLPSKELLYWINFEHQGELKTLGHFPVRSWRYGQYKQKFVIDLDSKFPGQEIEISTYLEFIRVDFKNGSEESYGNSVGLLGDFKTGKTLSRDGFTVLDDFTEYGSDWQVLPSDYMLFHDVAHPQFPQKCIEPEDPRGARRRRLDESSVSEADAEKACATLDDPLDRKDCIYDILATQDLGMVGAY
jgi:hypothetical protein